MGTYTNFQLEQMGNSLGALLPMRDIVGYKAAVNMRTISGLIADYIEFKDALIREYGTDVKDDSGNVVDCVVTPGCDGYREFMSRLREVAEIEHEGVTFRMLSEQEIIGKLSGEEMLDVDWMIEREVEHEHADNRA